MVWDLYLIDVRRCLIIPIILRLIIVITAITVTTRITAWINLELFDSESDTSKLHSVILFNLYTILQLFKPMLFVSYLLISCQFGCLLVLVTHDLPCEVEMVYRIVLFYAVRFKQRLRMVDPIWAVLVNDREKLLVIFGTAKFWHDSLEVCVVTDQHTTPHQFNPTIFQDFRLVIKEAVRVSVPKQGADF